MDILELLKSIIAGVIQGATELLPISSSGHLLLYSEITDQELQIAEIAILHFGTLGAIIIAFRKQLKKLLNFKVLLPVIISTIPAGILGLLFEDFIDKKLDSPWIIMYSLIFWGVVMIFVDQGAKTKKFETTKLSSILPTQSVLVGLAQSLALIPGTSRSGITTLSGIILGIEPGTALSFSFLSGIFLIGASGIYSITKMIIGESNSHTDPAFILIALVTSFIIGILAAMLFQKTIRKRIFTICGFYRIIIGIVIGIMLVNN